MLNMNIHFIKQDSNGIFELISQHSRYCILYCKFATDNRWLWSKLGPGF
jgi:hypothetical protein